MSADPQPETRSVTTADAPVLTVGDLRLVPLTDSDADDLVEAVHGDAAVERYSISLRRVRDVGTALGWLASRRRDGHIDWGIRDARGRLVGRTALHDVDLRLGTGEVGYTVFAPFRRQGIASRVTAAVAAYGFELGLSRIELVHAVANEASCGVARRCGFPLEGQIRSALLHPDGGREDAHLHARVADDPPGPQSASAFIDAFDLISDGLRLRPWREDDAEFLLRAMDDPGVSLWNPLKIDGRPIVSLEDTRRLAARLADWSGGPRGQHCSWVITEVGDDRALGHISLYDVDPVGSSAGIGYWIDASARGRGLAARAVTLAAGWAYPSLGLQRIELFHAVENPASCAVARSAGFALEGTMRASYRYGDGELHDEHAHARLSDDPPGPIGGPRSGPAAAGRASC